MKFPALKTLLTWFCFVVSFTAYSQAITVDATNFEAGAYGTGSSITVPLKIKGCFELKNKFELILSDATGSFTSGTVKIGEFKSFFAPFINGQIPAGVAAGTQYKLRIQSTHPVRTVETPVFSINATAATAVPAPTVLDPATKISDTVFGKCKPTNDYSIFFNFSSSFDVIKVLDSSHNNVPIGIAGPTATLNTVLGNYYKLMVKTTIGTVISTRSFLVLASTINLSLQTAGNNELCLPEKKTYTVNITGNNSIKTNYPGTFYIFSWGDGSKADSLSYCELMDSAGSISHVYAVNSCGAPPITDITPPQYNAFKVTVTGENLFCDKSIFTPLTTYSKVFAKPKPKFVNPGVACVNKAVTFTNTSEAGNAASGNAQNCSNNNYTSVWFVNDVPLSTTKNFSYTFTTPGVHHIKLRVNNGACEKDSIMTICIEPAPIPDFKMNGLDTLEGCSPLTIAFNNLTNDDTICRPMIYKWKVLTPALLPATASSYQWLSSDTAKYPSVKLLDSGQYVIEMQVTNTCGSYIKRKPVTVAAGAEVRIPFTKSYCGLKTIDFATDTSHKPIYSTNEGAETYNWVITGGPYSFVAPTSAASRYPVIQFLNYGTYSATVNFINDCGTTVASQAIILHQPVRAVITNPSPILACYNQSSINLVGDTVGSVQRLQWLSLGTGTFSYDTIINPVYNISTSDKTAASIQIKFITTPTQPTVCLPDTTSVAVIIRPNNYLTNAEDSFAVCSSSSFNFVPSAVLSGSSYSYTSAVISGSINGNSASGNGSINNVLVNNSSTNEGVVKYTITPKKDGCDGQPFVVAVRVKPVPTFSTSTTNATICSGQPAAIGLSSTSTLATYTWTANATSGVATGFSDQTTPTSASLINHTLVNVGLVDAVVTYNITVHNASSGSGDPQCSGETKTVTIIVKPGATAANAGNDQKLCNETQTILAGNNPAVGTGVWSVVSGTGLTIGNPSLFNTVVTGLQPDRHYVLRWSIGTGGGCPPNESTVNIYNRANNTVADAGADKSVCDFVEPLGATTLAANTPQHPGYETGTWSVISPATGGTILQPNNPASAFQFDHPGVYNLKWKISSDACPSTESNTTVRVFAMPKAGALSAPVSNLCFSSNITVSSAPSTGDISKWEIERPAGSGSWKDSAITTPVLSFNNVQDDFRTRMLVKSKGPLCSSVDTSNILAINISPITLGGNAYPDTVLCYGSNASIELGNQVGSVQYWEQASSISGPFTPIAGTIGLTTIVQNNLTSTKYFRAVLKSGSCDTARSTVATVTIAGFVTQANAGADQKICNQTSALLTGNNPTSGSGKWLQLAGPAATISNDANPLTNVTGLVPGDFAFIWKITGLGNCPPSSDTVYIYNRPDVTQSIVENDKVVCDHVSLTSNSTSISANVNAARTYEQGLWTVIQKPGTALTSIANVNQNNTTFFFNQPGIYKLEWLISNDGGCTATKDTLTIAVYSKAQAGNVSPNPINVCFGADVTLSHTSFTGVIQKWQYKLKYNSGTWKDTLHNLGSITFLNVSDSFDVRSIVVSTGFAEGCSSGDTSAIMRVNVAPVSVGGNSAPDTSICSGSNFGQINLTAYTGNIIKWQYSTNNGGAWVDVASTNSLINYSNLTATRWYRAVVQSGVCPIAYSDTAIITVKPGVTVANAGVNQVLCNQSSITLNGTSPATGEQGLWKQLAGPIVTLGSLNVPSLAITNLLPGTYSFEWSIANNVCPSTKDTVEVINYPALLNSIESSNITICNGQSINVSSTALSGGNGAYTFQWQQSTNGTTWTNINGATTANLVHAPVSTVFIRRYVYSAPCENASNSILVTVQPSVSNNNISGNQSICYNSAAATLTGAIPTGGDGTYTYTWESSLNGTTWATIAGAVNKDYSPGLMTQTTYYRRLVNTSLCTGAQSSSSNVVSIIVNPDAKAEYVITKTIACPPFNINTSIINTVTYPTRNSQYLWYANGNFIGSGATFPGFLLANQEDSVVIKLKTISLHGCLNDSMEHEFFTYVMPATAFTASDTVGCGPMTVNFTNTTPGASRFNFYWDFGNGIVHSGIHPPVVTFNTHPGFGDTIYKVTLNGFTICDTVRQVQYIRVKSKPKALFTPDKSSGCSPFTVSFNNTTRGNNVSYAWDFDDGFTLNTNNKVPVQHTYYTGVQDTMRVKLKATNECGTDSLVYALVVSPNTVKLDFAVNGNQLSGCKPHLVQFINNSVGGTSFKWDFADGNVLNTTKNIDTVPHLYNSTGTYVVKLFGTNGCSDTMATETIHVFNKPIANFTAQPLTVCVGDSILFTNQTDTATGVLWKFGDGQTSNLSNPYHFYTAAGVYQVRLVATRQYSIGNACSDSVTKTVTVVSKLPGKFTVNDSIGNCTPFTVTFTNNNHPSSLTVWDFGNGKKDTGDVVTHTFTVNGNYVVKMVALDPGGCRYEHQKTIKVNAPSGSWTYQHGFICGGTAVKFQASMANTDSIRWSFGDGTTQVTTTPVVYHSYSQPGLYLPKAELLSGTCSIELPGIDTIKVDYINAGYHYSLNQVCGSTTYQFSDTSDAFFGIKNYAWSFGDATGSVNKNPVHTYNNTFNYTVRLIATSNSGCKDTVNKVINVFVRSKPSASILTDTVTCTGYSVSYHAIANSADSATLYSWQFSNGFSTTGEQVTNNYSTPGLYQATLILGTVTGCFDTATLNVRVHPKPIVTTNADQIICKGSTLQLVATGASSYNWTPGSGLSCISCPNPKATPQTTTQYFVTGTNSFGCSAKDSVTVTVAQPIQLNISGSDTICIGQSTQLHVDGATTYLWSPGTTLDNVSSSDPVATPQVTTRYRVIGFDEHNCFRDTGFVTVAVGKYPTVKLAPDTILATGTQYKLTSVITNGPIKQWQWLPAVDLSCVDCPQPVANVRRDICYDVTITNAYGCTAKDTTCIKVFCSSTQVFIPNAFTPGHHMNNILMVRGSGIQMVKSFRIFNRWGQVVFDKANFPANAKEFGWDGNINGKPAPTDIFIYTCEVVCENGTLYTYKGNVAILK